MALKRNKHIRINQKTKYLLTLPERTLRSITSAVVGMTSLASKTLIPKFIRKSSTYKVTFGMLQQFLIHSVAEVEQESPDIVLKDNYVMRKSAGTLIEGIGLLSIRFSPVWMLAIISDLIGGTQKYLDNLTNDFKSHGIIDQDANIDNVTALLEGISKSTKLGMEAIDQPPLNPDEYQKLKAASAANLKENKSQLKEVFKDLEKVWQNMVTTSKKEKLSLSKLNSMLTIDMMKQSTKKGFDMTKITLSSFTSIMKTHTIEGYEATLAEINQKGRKAYINDHLGPFLKQMPKHFKADKVTLSDKVIEAIFEVEDKGLE